MLRLFAVASLLILSVLVSSPNAGELKEQPELEAKKELKKEVVEEKGETLYSPFDAVKIATADAVALANLKDPEIDPHAVVYLSLHNYPSAKRKVVKAVADFVLNSLNARYRKLWRTVGLPNNDNPVVIRVNLNDYGIPGSAWKTLIEKGSGSTPLPEPYFNAQVVKTTEVFKEEPLGHYYTDDGKITNDPDQGTWKTTSVKKTKVGTKREITLGPAPWLELEESSPGSTINALREATGNTYPLARADWFITYASWAPRYYDLIGLTLKTNPADKEGEKVFLEKDFEDLMKFNIKLAEEDMVAAIVDSKIVTLHNRVLQRFTTVRGITGGSYWRSKDTKLGIDETEYMNNITNFKKPVIDAQEIIASGRNGMHLYALTNNKGVLINFADASIARHGDVMPVKWNDKQVWTGRNCMICHATGQLYINDTVRALAKGKIALLIADKSIDKTASREIDEAFSPDLKGIIDTDNAKFTASVLAACGLDAKTVAKHYEDVVYDYFDAPITLEAMALEAGLTPEKLEATLKKGINIHYALTSVLQQPAVDVYRLSWERGAYSAMMRYLIANPDKK